MSNRSRAQMGRGKHADTAVIAADDRPSATVDGLAAATSSLSSTLTRAQKRAESRRARLPESVRFALVLVLSFSLSSLSQVLLNASTGGELATIARESDSRKEVGLAVGWKMYVDFFISSTLSVIRSLMSPFPFPSLPHEIQLMSPCLPCRLRAEESWPSARPIKIQYSHKLLTGMADFYSLSVGSATTTGSILHHWPCCRMARR